MSRLRAPPWWLACLAPASLRVLVDLVDGRARPAAWAAAAAPALVLLAVVALVRSRRTPLALEVDRELRLLAPGLALTMGYLCAQQALGLDREQVLDPAGIDAVFLGKLRAAIGSFAVPLAGVGLFATASYTFGGEFAAGTMTSWAMTPRPRWVLVARKLAVLAAALGLATVQVLVLPMGLGELQPGPGELAVGSTIVLPMALLAFTVGPAGTLVTRTSSGALLGAVVAALAVVLCAALAGERGAWVAVALLAPLGLGVTFVVGTRLDPLASAPPDEGRWAARFARLVPGPLLRKELMLQRGTFAVGAAIVALWAGLMAVRALGLRIEGAKDLGWGPLVPLTLLCALAAGVVTFSQERALATADWMETTLTRPHLWRLKVTTSLASALLAALLVPAALVALSPGWEAVLADVAASRAGVRASAAALVGLWAAGALAAWAVGVFASTLAERELAATVGVVFGLFAVVGPVLLLIVPSGVDGPWAGCVGEGSARRLAGVAQALGPVQLLPVVVGALWSAHAVWRHGRSLRSAALAGVVVLVAVAALSAARLGAERASRAPACSAVDDSGRAPVDVSAGHEIALALHGRSIGPCEASSTRSSSACSTRQPPSPAPSSRAPRASPGRRRTSTS